MGLFSKLFEKKVCDICGGEIGLFGNRKLEDGNLCKACAAKLSPWFDERRHSTVEQIRAQLNYREENRSAVEAFHSTRTFGEGYILHLDEDQNKFLVARTRDLAEENPDVLDYAQVTGCELDIDESKHEEMQEYRDKEGKTQKKSYIPPRFTYSYDFNIVIRVNHPYFDDIRFQLNRNNVEIDVTGRGSFDPRMKSFEYKNYEDMGNEIRETLLNARQQVREEAAAAAAPRQAVTCPWCGATTTADANGCCEYCGGSLNN